MSSATVEPEPHASRTVVARGWRWWVVAAVGGAILGPLDLWGQVASPYPLAHLFNSPAVWAAAAFAYGLWVRRPVPAAIGAVVLLVVAVEAYYLADVLVRDADRGNLTSTTAAVWVAAGVLAGVVFGAAGAWATRRSGWEAVIGKASLPAVFGAEAVYDLLRLRTEPADGRPDDLGQFAALLGVLAVVSLAALVRRTDRHTAAAVVALAVAASVAVGSAVGAVT